MRYIVLIFLFLSSLSANIGLDDDFKQALKLAKEKTKDFYEVLNEVEDSK